MPVSLGLGVPTVGATPLTKVTALVAPTVDWTKLPVHRPALVRVMLPVASTLPVRP